MSKTEELVNKLEERIAELEVGLRKIIKIEAEMDVDYDDPHYVMEDMSNVCESLLKKG